MGQIKIQCELMCTNVAYSEERVERSVGHKLGDDHGGMTAGDNSDKADDIDVTELSHDARFSQELQSVLLRCARFERLNSDHCRTLVASD